MIMPLIAEAQGQGYGYGRYRDRPYGDSCPGPQGGGPYGARKTVTTADQARQIIETYYSSLGQAVGTGKIEERRWFFMAEVLNADGLTIDKVIVDKRSGRIRSID
jgi:hypothetical protein